MPTSDVQARRADGWVPPGFLAPIKKWTDSSPVVIMYHRLIRFIHSEPDEHVLIFNPQRSTCALGLLPPYALPYLLPFHEACRRPPHKERRRVDCPTEPLTSVPGLVVAICACRHRDARMEFDTMGTPVLCGSPLLRNCIYLTCSMIMQSAQSSHCSARRNWFL